MPSFKLSKIVKSNTSNNIVFDFQPKVFPLIISAQANDFVTSQKNESSDFKISDIVSAQTGIAKLQRQGLEDKMEELVLQRLKDVEEKAYQEAYDLGMVEGQEKAFAEKKAEIDQKLQSLDGLLRLFEELKQRFLAENERQIVELLVQIAGRIALREIQEDPQSIFRTLEMVLADVHRDEEVTVYLSASDLATIESFRQKGGKKAEELKRIKLEVSEGVTAGGCLVESHYGHIDATIEQRVDRVLLSMRERTPKVTTTSKGEEIHFSDTSSLKSPAASDSDHDSGGE